MSFPNVYGVQPRYGHQLLERVARYMGNVYGLTPPKIQSIFASIRRRHRFYQLTSGIMPWIGNASSAAKTPETNSCWIHFENDNPTWPINLKEAKYILDLLSYLTLQIRYKGKIGILTPYALQAARIQQMIHQNRWLSFKMRQSRILVGDTKTVLQGKCNLIVVGTTLDMNRALTDFQWLNSLMLIDELNLKRCGLVILGDNRLSKHPFCHRFKGAIRHAINRPIFCDLESLEHHPNEKALERATCYPYHYRLFVASARLGIPLLTNYSFKTCNIDFVLIKKSHRLAILLESEYYDKASPHMNTLDKILSGEPGWTVMHFSLQDLHNHFSGCVEQIRQWHDNTFS